MELFDQPSGKKKLENVNLALGQLFLAESGPEFELELFGQVGYHAKYCRPGCLKLSHFVLVVGALMSLPNAKKPFVKLTKDCFPLVKMTFFLPLGTPGIPE